MDADTSNHFIELGHIRVTLKKNLDIWEYRTGNIELQRDFNHDYSRNNLKNSIYN